MWLQLAQVLEVRAMLSALGLRQLQSPLGVQQLQSALGLQQQLQCRPRWQLALAAGDFPAG